MNYTNALRNYNHKFRKDGVNAILTEEERAAIIALNHGETIGIRPSAVYDWAQQNNIPLHSYGFNVKLARARGKWMFVLANSVLCNYSLAQFEEALHELR